MWQAGGVWEVLARGAGEGRWRGARAGSMDRGCWQGVLAGSAGRERGQRGQGVLVGGLVALAGSVGRGCWWGRWRKPLPQLIPAP